MTTKTSITSFEELSLSAEMLHAIQDLNYTKPTEIQAAAIPLLLSGGDVIGYSATGTGKTAAFGIPAIEFVCSAEKNPQILVLAPTRELAMQIASEMRKFAKYKQGISIAAVYGGASMQEQIRQLRKANIVIGTPGRIMDHMRRKTLKLDHIKMTVLDEADEMLSMGFIEDIQTILSEAPETRQSILFSATISDPILKISKEFLKSPELVNVQTEQLNPAEIEQTFYYVPHAKKQEALSLLLKHTDTVKSVVFCNTKSMVDELAANLTSQGFSAAGLHGDMTQDMRSQIMQRFRNGTVAALIATDVAARGIDVSNIDTVINYDLPQSFEYYVHRIGRTGRAGKTGISQTLVCNKKQLYLLRALMKYTGKPITECRLPTGSDIMARSASNTAGEIVSRLDKPAGDAAKLLIAQIFDQSNQDLTMEQVALALAGKIMGSDKNYASISSLSSDAPKKPSRKNEENRAAPSLDLIADAGHISRMTPRHFVAAITEELNIPGSAIGKIDIRKESSVISLRGDFPHISEGIAKPIHIDGISVSFRLQKRIGQKSSHRPKSNQSFRTRPRRKRDSRSA